MPSGNWECVWFLTISMDPDQTFEDSPHAQHAEPKSKAPVLEEAWFKCLQARQKLGIMIPQRPRPATPSKAKGEVKREKNTSSVGEKNPSARH